MLSVSTLSAKAAVASIFLLPAFLMYLIGPPTTPPIVPPATAPAAAASPNCFQKSVDEYNSARLAPSFISATVEVMDSCIASVAPSPTN